MQKLTFLCGTLAIAFLSTFAQANENPPLEDASQDVTVIALADLTEDDLLAFGQGLYPDLAVEFSAQTTLPISIDIKGDLASTLQDTENLGSVQITQTFYAKFSEDTLLLSSNLVDWKPFVEFATGQAFIGLMHENGHPVIKLGADFNRR